MPLVDLVGRRFADALSACEQAAYSATPFALAIRPMPFGP
jgi:hypothetical protein